MRIKRKQNALEPLSKGAIRATGANGGLEANTGARSLRSKLWELHCASRDEASGGAGR